MSKQASWNLGSCDVRGVARFGALLALAFAAGEVAQAQTTAPATGNDSSLTWKGITLYGILDIGVQYDTHSPPFSDYFPATSGSFLQKNGYDSPTGLTSSNLSQSKIGLSGNEPLWGDWAAVFRLETFFNPSSGNLADALKSVTVNNGKALTSQTLGVDSSVAGQAFAGAAYVGLASPTVGSFTFGRNVTIVADGISKYDPAAAAQAFSVIGYSGTAAGGGDTEDRRLDQSIKYVAKYGPVHVGALYEFGSQSGSTDTGYQFQLGGEFAGLSVDAYYFKKYDAIAVSSLSAAQVTDVINNCNADISATPPPKTARCYSVSNALAGTISDNKTYMITALYNLGGFNLPLTLYAGYEHITFDDPTDPLSVGTVIIGGYVLATANNTAYKYNERTLQIVWGGLKWNITPDLDFITAYYGYKQNSYGKIACSDASEATCSGNENAISGVFDYRLSKRFDVYAGSFWSGVQNGLANGYYAKNNVATTLGVRFKF